MTTAGADDYVEDWAGHFMFCLYVEDLDEWPAHIKAMGFNETYGGTARVINEPHHEKEARSGSRRTDFGATPRAFER